MGRGIARKAELTKKCSCDNPEWSQDDIEVNGSTKEITYILHCRNCRANWGTKTSKAREYWSDKMDSVPVVWKGYAYKGNHTVRELFHQLDMERLEYLESIQKAAEKRVSEMQKEADKAKATVYKFKKQLEELQ
jgi:hypothetical protein